MFARVRQVERDDVSDDVGRMEPRSIVKMVDVLTADVSPARWGRVG